MIRRFRTDAAAAALLAALVIVLYRKVTRLWWMWDDPFHINLLSAQPFRGILFGRVPAEGALAVVLGSEPFSAGAIEPTT